jgi:NADPH-dependent 7-cyano-7-deazaguanine reductase QueF-like protein
VFCENCLGIFSNKLLPNEIRVLEYLRFRGATISQCAISRTVIRDELGLTTHKCFTSLDRLECYDFVMQPTKSKSNKYYVTSFGETALINIEKKIGGAMVD